jgi:hypothetical protein
MVAGKVVAFQSLLRSPDENQMEQDQGCMVNVSRFQSIAAKANHQLQPLTQDVTVTCTLSSYTLPDNAQGLVPVYPRTASLFPLLGASGSGRCSERESRVSNRGKKKRLTTGVGYSGRAALRREQCNMHACLRPLLSNSPRSAINSGNAC